MSPLLAEASFALVAAVKPKAIPLLPPRAELDTQLGDSQASWATLLTRVLDAHIEPLFTAIPGTAIEGAPGSGLAAWDSEAQIRQVMSVPGSITFTLPATNSLPLAKADVLDFKLRVFQPATNDILNALDTYLDYVAAGRVLAPALTATKDSAKNAIRELVSLEAFLIRYSAAINAAAESGLSLAETLALYRVEGNLIAPMSTTHLADRLPVHEQIDIRNLGEDTNNVSLTMKRALWSYPFKALAVRALGISPAALPTGGLRPVAELRVKGFALMHWLLMTGGLDFLGKLVPLPIDSPTFRTLVTGFSDAMRIVRGAAPDPATRGVEFDSVIVDLKCTWPADANGRVVIAPDTPVLLASYCLTQAMLFFRLDHTEGSGPFVEPHSDLRYLAYNLQHARSDADRTKDRFSHLLASAAVAAAKSTRPAFAPLKASLAPLGLPARLKKDPKSDSSEHVAVFDKLTAGATSFLGDATNSGRLAEFILLAEHGDWNTFEQNRGNLARYRKLLTYYTALLS